MNGDTLKKKLTEDEKKAVRRALQATHGMTQDEVEAYEGFLMFPGFLRIVKPKIAPEYEQLEHDLA